jgi:hypothetical protein
MQLGIPIQLLRPETYGEKPRPQKRARRGPSVPMMDETPDLRNLEYR